MVMLDIFNIIKYDTIHIRKKHGKHLLVHKIEVRSFNIQLCLRFDDEEDNDEDDPSSVESLVIIFSSCSISFSWDLYSLWMSSSLSFHLLWFFLHCSRFRSLITSFFSTSERWMQWAEDWLFVNVICYPFDANNVQKNNFVPLKASDKADSWTQNSGTGVQGWYLIW